MQVLKRTAVRICRDEGRPRSISALAVAVAVAEVNSPLLTALHTGKTGMVAAAR